MNNIKTLSVRQPYAELIVQGRKTIELRKWNTKFRGKFLVHASKYQPSYLDVEAFGFNLFNLGFGALIGTAELVDVKDYEKYPITEWLKDKSLHLAGSDYITSKNGFILKNAMKFTNPIEFKGKLNFFDVPDTILPQSP